METTKSLNRQINKNIETVFFSMGVTSWDFNTSRFWSLVADWSVFILDVSSLTKKQNKIG